MKMQTTPFTILQIEELKTTIGSVKKGWVEK